MRALAFATALLFLPPLQAQTLSAQLEARFKGDRTGTCVVAAVIGKERVEKARYCARSGDGPAMDAAFEIGSVSKTMAAYLVADLIEQGRWSLDDPIARHLPAGTVIPAQGERQILVRDLLTHSAGLPGLPARMNTLDGANPYANLSEADLLASLADVKLSRPIGSVSAYSNFGMMLVSLAVARSYGGELESALRERLFKPLKMDASHVSGNKPAGPVAIGHLPGGAVTSAWTITPNLAGVGQILSTLDDMVRYAQAQLGLAGDAKVIARMQRTQQPLAHNFGMNWALAKIKGRDVVLHQGGTGGFSSIVALEPARQRAVVMMADTGLADLGSLGDIGLSLLGIDIPVQAPRVEVAAPAAARQALLGDYDFGGTVMRIFEGSEGRLMAQVPGQQAIELFHDKRGDFYPKIVSALLTPMPVEGRVDRFVWRQGGGVNEARRRQAPVAGAALNPLWKQWAGDYALHPQFSLRVFEEAGRLMIQGTAQPAIAAEVTGTDKIEVKALGVLLEFKRDAASGDVVSATLKQNGQLLQGPRKAL